MVICGISQCGNSSKTDNLTSNGVTFHRFPLNGQMRDKWASVTGKKNWCPSNNSRICSEHFKEDDFQISTIRRTLLTKAIPTVNVWIFCPDITKLTSPLSESPPPSTASSSTAPTFECALPDNMRERRLLNEIEQKKLVNSAQRLKIRNLLCKTRRYHNTILKLRNSNQNVHNPLDTDPSGNSTSPSPAQTKQPEQTQNEPLLRVPEAKVIIGNVYLYLKKEYDTLTSSLGDSSDLSPLANIFKRTAEATGVSQRTVRTILSKRKHSRDIKKEPAAKKRRKTRSTLGYDDTSPVEEDSSSEIVSEDHRVNDAGQIVKMEPEIIEMLKVEFEEEEEKAMEAAKVSQDPSESSVHTPTTGVQDFTSFPIETAHIEVKLEPIDDDYQQSPYQQESSQHSNI